MAPDIRILFLADSHLGFDLPSRPRIERRRRGHDFLANYATALAPAFADEVDLVVHGDDVFDHSHVVPTTACQAFEPLRRIADRRVPVYIVPGNHERSRLPHLRFAAHPHIHIFDRPRTFVVNVRRTRVALSGFPYERDSVRAQFVELLERVERKRELAEYRVLCLHLGRQLNWEFRPTSGEADGSRGDSGSRHEPERAGIRPSRDHRRSA